jgi:plastocyanin
VQKLLASAGGIAIVALAAFFMVAPHNGGNVTVRIERSGFVPATAHVKAGQRVEFINDTRATHTATCQGCALTTGDVQPGGVSFVEFPAAGTYSFKDAYGNATGTVLVG